MTSEPTTPELPEADIAPPGAPETEVDPFTPMEWGLTPPDTWPAPWTSEPVGPGVRYLLRTSSADRQSNGHATMEVEAPPIKGGFLWPETGYVQAGYGGPWWGIYGLLDGVGDWGRLPRHREAVWQIIAVVGAEAQPSPQGGCHRVPRGWVVYTGDAVGAVQMLVPYMARTGKLVDLAKLFWDDAIEPESEIARARGRLGVVGAPPDLDAVTTGDDGIAFSYGQNRTAVAYRGLARSYGNFGCAVALKGGHADAIGICSDAVVRRSVNSECGQPLGYASAGMFGVAAALGPGCAARARIGGAVFLTEWVEDSLGSPKLVSVYAGIVNHGKGVSSGKWYRLVNGKPQEVDGPEPTRSHLVYGWTPDV